MAIPDYLNLVPPLHRQKPKYMATVEGLLKPLDDLAAVLERMRAAFDVDTAVGVQLDAVGVRVGRSRLLYTPLEGYYFTWDPEGAGWNESLWRGPYDPIQGLTSLPDDVYRLLLKAKIAANAWDGTIDGAYAAWEAAFADTGSTILIEDHQDMSMVIGVARMPLNSIFEQLLLQGYVPLKPEGVRLRWYSITPDNGPLFAWNTESGVYGGWGAGAWPERLIPNQAANHDL